MEKFQEFRELAKKKLNIADHLLSVSYPLLKEPKLLISVAENTFLAYTYMMSSLLHYDRMFNKIPAFEDNFDSKFNAFKDKSVRLHNIDADFLKEMYDLKLLLTDHRKSPVEFSRNDKFVICSDKFDVKTISAKDMERYIKKCSLFIHFVESRTAENEGLFRQRKE